MFGLLAWNPEATHGNPWDTNLSPFSVFNLWVVTVVTSQVRHGQLQLLLSEGKCTWQDHLVMWLVTPEPC
jgi:hypothetical protein